MRYDESLPTYQDHPIYKIIDSPVRRKILQLLAIEPNYGTRLSSILRLSPPGLHRHLQRLILFNENGIDVSIIHEDQRSKDYSGWKGAEAILYGINTELLTVFGIFPNFIHSRTIELNDKVDIPNIEEENFNPLLFGVEFNDNQSENSDLIQENYLKIQELNLQIKQEEESLIAKLNQKNDLLQEIDDVLADDLTSQEKVVLKSILSNGLGSMKMISELLSAERVTLDEIIESLKKKGWIKDKEIQVIH